MPPSVSPSGTARESLGDRALESVTASANTQIWAVKSLGELPGPRAEWAPPKRRARRFNAELPLQGSVHLDPVTHGEVVSEHLNPQRMRQAGLPFEVRSTLRKESETRPIGGPIIIYAFVASCRIRQKS